MNMLEVHSHYYVCYNFNCKVRWCAARWEKVRKGDTTFFSENLGIVSYVIMDLVKWPSFCSDCQRHRERIKSTFLSSYTSETRELEVTVTLVHRHNWSTLVYGFIHEDFKFGAQARANGPHWVLFPPHPRRMMTTERRSPKSAHFSL